MRYFFVAEDRSSDLVASYLIDELKLLDPTSTFSGWGGIKMNRSGVRISRFFSDFTYFIHRNPLTQLANDYRRQQVFKRHFKESKADIFILFENSSFWINRALELKKDGVKICLFNNPKKPLTRDLLLKYGKDWIDLVLTLSPLDVVKYQEYGLNSHFLGNPIFECISKSDLKKLQMDDSFGLERRIAFLPGSREQDVKKAIDVVLKLSPIYEEYEFLIAGLSYLKGSLYAPILHMRNVRLFFDQPHEVLRACHVAIITAGTASVEAAILGIPQMVVMRKSFALKDLFRNNHSVDFVSLINQIAGKRVVKELVGTDYNPVDIASELEFLLYDTAYTQKISEGYSEILPVVQKEHVAQKMAEKIYALGSS